MQQGLVSDTLSLARLPYTGFVGHMFDIFLPLTIRLLHFRTSSSELLHNYSIISLARV